MATLPDIVGYRASLLGSEFPFLSELKGHSVILPGIDDDTARAQAYYMHNVVPTKQGYTSVGYLDVALPPADQDGTFQKAFAIRDSSENMAFYCRTASGRNYIFLSVAFGWLRTTDVAMAAGFIVTTAYVNGTTYINFGGTGTYRYDFATNTLIAVVLLGVVAANVLGIFASNGYMLLWTTSQVLWSSTLNPIDFVASTVTGAGGGNIQNTKAAIVLCAPQNTGFIIYTKRNAVSGLYTGNAQFPFSFKEVQGVGGTPNATVVSFDGNSGSHVAYTTAGIQQVTANVAQIIYPELTDFIAGAQFEDYNELTLEFTSIPLSVPMAKKLVVISNRYLVFSYGVTQLTHALIYDISLGRWGKLKFTHVDCFEYVYPASDVVEAPKRSIGFLTAEGRISVAVISYETAGSNGVLLLGKYQLDRNRLCSVQEISLESVRYGNNLIVSLRYTLDGATILTTTPTLTGNAMTQRKYVANSVGMNHSLLITGAFHLHSVQFKFIDEGEA